MIADNDPLNASTLRVAQQKTNKRIVFLREKYRIPEGQLPPEDMLWLNDLTCRELERWSLRNRGKTTYARALAPSRRHERLPRSLVELGYLRSRFVAYRDNKAAPACAATEIHHDEYGTFILVDDLWGSYQGDDGATHDATAEGYTVVIQQFLYCFEVVNAAIAVLDGVAPSESLQRWQQKTSTGQGTHRNCNLPAPGDAKENTSTIATVSGGYLYSVVGVSAFTSENTTNQGNTSIIANSEDTNGHTLRTAPWTVETILALQSAVLPVPDRVTCDPAIWDKEWQRPTELAMVKLQTLSPQLAFERIDLTTRYMIDPTSPSYWQTGRLKQTPTTMRHIANHIVDYYDAYKKGSWHPATTTPYDGPPLQYEAGYTGVTQANEEPPVPVVEETSPIARPQGMKQRTAERMRDRIWQEYPTLFLGLLPLSEDRYAVSIQIGEDMWHDIPSSADWYQPTEVTQASLEQALHFAAQRDAIPTEVGVIAEQPEPPPIALEPQDNDAPEEPYLSMEEISADLERGLRPLGSPSVVEVVEKSLPVQNEPYERNLTSLPQGKQGMSLVIAQFLLDRIISEGYEAHLRPISDDRAVLSVEASPGQWIDIESGVAWQRHLKSVAQSPPAGSVGTVLAMNVGQAMEVAQS